MPNVIVRRPRTEQPQGPVPLRKELYENLLGYFPNSENDLPTYPLTFAGNAAYGVTEFGRATKFDGAGDYTSAGDAFYSDEYTILVTVNANLLNADPKGIIIKRNLGTSASTNEIWLTATSTTIEMYAWQSGGTRILTLQSSLVPVAGQTYTIGLDIPPGSGTAYMYINGALVASASKTGIIVDSATDLQFGCMGSGVAARYWNGYIGPAAFWSKRLPNTQDLTANPWAILEDEKFPVWFSATTGVSGTIAVTLEAFTSSIAGTTTIVGSMASTVADATSAITGTTSVTGSIAKTLENDVGNFQGTTAIVGSIAKTLENDVGNFQGSTGSTSGTIAVTTENNVANMAGTTAVVGNLNASTENATSNITGTTTILGQISSSISNFISSIFGTSGSPSLVARLLSLLGVGP